MIRILFFVAVILALGLGFAWLADRPGEMILTWQGQRLETSLLVGIAGLVAVVVVVMLAWWLLRSVFTTPETMRRFFRNRKRDRGYRALSSGLIAAGAGDAMLARRMTRRTRSLLSTDEEPLIHVLEAQTYMIEGRHDAARAKFEAMSEIPETKALGLRGLYLEARRLGSSEAAQHYAEKAVEKAPQLPWAGQATLEYKSRDGQWDDALKLLEKQRSTRVIDKTAYDRKRAVLLTGRAMASLEGNPRQAGADAQEALRLAPTLVPAGVTAAKALFRQNDLRKGSRILEKIWKSVPHPEVADTYVRARAGDSTEDRLKRAKRLEALKPNHVESLRIVAQAALDAHDYPLARERAEAALRQQPREGIYLLMADIEEADTGDQGRVRHWMAQALRAERDPVWTADGYVADEWSPISPVTGALDAFVWKVPVEQLQVRQIESETDSIPTAEAAIESLPPVEEPHVVEPVPTPEPAPTAKPEARDTSSKTKAGSEPPKEPPAQSSKAAEAEAPGEPAKAAEAKPEPEKAESDAKVIPLQPPAKTAAGKADGATASDTAADSSAKPQKGETTAPAKNGKLPVVADEKDATAATAEESSTSTPATEKDVGTRPFAGESEGEDPDRAEEERFMKHRIDDPGVRPRTAETSSGSRFRLF